MSTVKYQIQFFSNWHCGSGLSAGADVDALCIKDSEGIPYVPGRTIKGLLRDASTFLFGSENSKMNAIMGISGSDTNHAPGCAFFTNATFPNEEKALMVSRDLASHLFQTFASTAIDDEGIAKDNTLRKIETVVPCILVGEILNVPDDESVIKMIDDALRYIKRLGLGRNRGFGRCEISIIK